MTPLHEIGDFIRNILLAVPMPLVRIFFILVPLLLLLWVLFLPKSQTQPPEEAQGRWNNLKIWAALALVIQIVLYTVF
jgi:hypothetical protein